VKKTQCALMLWVVMCLLAGSAWSQDVASDLNKIATAGNLLDLRYPDFSDYRIYVLGAYQTSGFTPLWLQGKQPTLQAAAVIAALRQSQLKGLDPEEYDASRWPARIEDLQSNSADAETIAIFDVALTVASMRYISDLHIGRVSPAHFDFGIDIAEKKYDLAQFLTANVIHAADVKAVLAGVEPQYDGYRRAEAALDQYQQLAARGDGPAVPDVQKTVAPGGDYIGSAELEARLQLLGDLQNAPATVSEEQYDPSLVEAVKKFQTRHGLTIDGKLDKETIRQLNVPLSARVVQLEDVLERWRWLPAHFPQPPVVVNVPEFVLRVFEADQSVALSMNVVVGKALRTETPLFAETMKYIVFRPYWNVPPSIVRGEIIPAIVRDRGYIGKKGFEITDTSGKVLSSGTVSDELLAQLKTGKLMVRQKPGPTNALGLVKFIFPNSNNVYLHSTPAPQLFSQARRDFSHGCVRVQKPAELAAYLLRNQPPWTLEKVRAAMQSGPDNQQVNLKTPIPVLIVYQTAVVEPDHSVYFFEDIYGYDRALNAVLAKGPPYP
jgi:L,D-transpeptidase YcbB